MNTRHWVYHFIYNGKEGEREREEGSQGVDRTLCVQERGRVGEDLGRMTAKGRLNFVKLAGKLTETHSLGREEIIFQGIQ